MYHSCRTILRRFRASTAMEETCPTTVTQCPPDTALRPGTEPIPRIHVLQVSWTTNTFWYSKALLFSVSRHSIHSVLFHLLSCDNSNAQHEPTMPSSLLHLQLQRYHTALNLKPVKLNTTRLDESISRGCLSVYSPIGDFNGAFSANPKWAKWFPVWRRLQTSTLDFRKPSRWYGL